MTDRPSPRPRSSRQSSSAVAALAVATLALGALAACAGAPQTDPTYQNPNSRAFAQSAMTSGPMLVKLQGNPYPVPAARLEQTVLPAMQRAMNWTATPRLTTDPAAAATSSFYVVMTFNGAVGDAGGQCSGSGPGSSTGSAMGTSSGTGSGTGSGAPGGQAGEPAAGGSPPRPDDPVSGGAVQVTASFCDSGAMTSSTSRRIDQSTGIDDPRFAQMIEQVTDELFPSYWRQMPGVGLGVGIGGGGLFGGGGGVGVGTGGGVGIGAGIGRFGW